MHDKRTNGPQLALPRFASRWISRLIDRSRPGAESRTRGPSPLRLSASADTNSRGSLAYRKSRDAIWHADVPEKYARLIEHIPGNRILEMGAAEGVLALLLAQRKEKVIALEKNAERHEEALRLQAHWKDLGLSVSHCEMVLGSITDRLDLLEQVDTFLGVRSIYYLRDDVQRVFDRIGERVENVVLCGNKNRARRYIESGGSPDDKLGRFNFYASIEGMISVLERAGYAIVETVTEGDPIVVGAKSLRPAMHR